MAPGTRPDPPPRQRSVGDQSADDENWYEPLPAIVATAEAAARGAPLVFDDCPNNICFVALFGDKAATDAAFAHAPHVVKQRLVINRVTAASMEPRGSIGVYQQADERYTVYTTLQRTFPFREELARLVLKVPENKDRVIAGDIGGAFGMKTAIYNEVALVLLGAKLTGRPVKWISTRSEAFLSDGQARDNVVDAELALDKDGNFLGVRVKTFANVGAYLQMGSHCPSRTSARLPASIAPRWHMPTSLRCSPTPIRCGPIAATAAAKRPI